MVNSCVSEFFNSLKNSSLISNHSTYLFNTLIGTKSSSLLFFTHSTPTRRPPQSRGGRHRARHDLHHLPHAAAARARLDADAPRRVHGRTVDHHVYRVSRIRRRCAQLAVCGDERRFVVSAPSVCHSIPFGSQVAPCFVHETQSNQSYFDLIYMCGYIRFSHSAVGATSCCFRRSPRCRCCWPMPVRRPLSCRSRCDSGSAAALISVRNAHCLTM